MRMRAVLLGMVVVCGLASFAFADDSTTQPSGRAPWDKVYADYEKLDSEHGHTSSEILATERLLHDADVQLAPFHAVEAYLHSNCAPGDPRIADAAKATYEKVTQLKVGENRVTLIQLQKKELETREAAIAAGKTARQALGDYLDLMGLANVGNRADQVEKAKKAYLALLANLDSLENQGNPLSPPFTPLAKIPGNLGQIVHFIRFYEDDAKKSAELATSLSDRVKAKKADQARLLKFVQAGVKMEHLEELLKRLDTRIEEIDTARQAATKRAEDIRQEIARLEKRKAEIEASLTKKPGAKDGEKK